MKLNYLLKILSQDRKGLVSIITGMLNRKGIEIESISAAKTDTYTNVLITIEVVADLAELRMMVFKIKNIIEVSQVTSCLLQDAVYHKVALYSLDKQAYNSDMYNKLQKYGAVILGYDKDKLIIQKTGRDEHILALYNLLEGRHLIDFSKSAAISLMPFTMDDEESVISRAA